MMHPHSQPALDLFFLKAYLAKGGVLLVYKLSSAPSVSFVSTVLAAVAASVSGLLFITISSSFGFASWITSF